MIPEADAVAAMPDGYKGSASDSKGKLVSIKFERVGSDYRASLHSDKGDSVMRVRFFDFGAADGVYGVQVMPNVSGKTAESYFQVVRLRHEAGLQIHTYNLGLDDAGLTNAGVSFTGDQTSGYYFESRADVIAAMRAAVKGKTLKNALTFFPSTGSRNSGYFSAGFIQGDLMEQIWKGNPDHLAPGPSGLYLTVFAGMFTNADGSTCKRLVSPATTAALSVIGTVDTLGKLFGPLVEAHKRGSDGRDDAARDGAQAGFTAVIDAATARASARQDAQHFYDLYGCEGPVATRFFRNFNNFAQGN